MTGANRLLIGIGWPLMSLVAWLRFRRRHVTWKRSQALELVVLLAATLYAFILPFKGDLTLIDMVVLVVDVRLLYLGASPALLPSSRSWSGRPGSIGNLAPAPRRRL